MPPPRSGDYDLPPGAGSPDAPEVNAPSGADQEFLGEVAALVASQLAVSSVFIARGTDDPVRFEVVLTHRPGTGATMPAPGSVTIDLPAEQHSMPIEIENVTADDRDVADSLSSAFPDHQSFLVVPLPRKGDSVAGLLGAGHGEPRSFTPAQRDLILRAARLIRFDQLSGASPADVSADAPAAGTLTPASDRMVATVSRVLRSGEPETVQLALDEVADPSSYEIRLLVGGPGETVTVVRGTAPQDHVDAALRSEPHLIQTLIDLLPELIFVKDANSRFTRVNRAVAEDFGVADSSEFLGKTDFDFFPEPVARVFFEQERELFRTGVPIISQLERQPRLNRPDQWRRTFKIPIRDATGAIVGLVGSSWDVTAAFERQQALERLAALVQWSNDAIIGMDTAGQITSWNPAAERLFGYAAHEILGRPYVVLVPSGEQMILWEELVRQGPNEYGGSLETRRQCKDGTVIEVEIKASLIRDELGEPAGVSTIIREIGERKAAERQLQELEQRYRMFVERMPAHTYISPPGGESTESPKLHMSQRIEELTGYAAANWLENPLFTREIMHPDDRDWVIAIDQETNVTGEPYRAEYRLITADGRTVWIRDEAVLVHDEQGAPLYWLGFVLDITDLKRAEGELTEALEGQRAANIELERVSRAKGEIVSVISHEFRTPLTSIQGFSELLIDETLTREEIGRFATTINTNAQRLARMISDVLDLERLESGRSDLRQVPVDLNGVAVDVVESLQPTTSDHVILLQLDGDLPRVLGDPDLLTQVVTNLVGNAIKYSPSGGSITIATEERPATVELWVKDEGLGIPDVALETIFARYTRLARPEQHAIEGTGLGLPIARQIVEMLGGKIWAERPADGVGALFRVELPKQPA
jgi:PAS domain S-box-containing protein